MATVHTHLGPGEIIAEDVVRGRKSYRVAGQGFDVWLDEAKVGGLHREAWAPVNFDNSTALPYNPDPQFPAIPGNTESTIQPIHHIDPDERLRDVDSVTFREREESHPSPKFAGWQNDPTGASWERAGGDIGSLPGYGGGSPNDYGAGPEEYHEGWKADNPGEHPADSPFFEDLHPRAQERELAEYGDAGAFGPQVGRSPVDYERQASHREAIAPAVMAIAPALMRAVGPAVARGAGGAVIDKVMGGGEGGEPGVEGGEEGPPVAESGGGGFLDKANEVIDAVRPGYGWGPLIKPSGLSDKYIDITANADYHHNPILQFRHDPDAYISRVGNVLDETDVANDIHLAQRQYMDLVEGDSQIREAAWKDVREKGVRLRTEGKVAVHDISPSRIMATVEGDTGVYDVMISREGMFGGVHDGYGLRNWRCACLWGQWAWKRKYSYVGRLCSHGYAAFLEMQSANERKRGGYPKRSHKTADALQMIPTRLTPELVINDADDASYMVDVTKDERHDTGPGDIMGPEGYPKEKGIEHFSSLMTLCDRQGSPYPRELVAYLERYAEGGWQLDDPNGELNRQMQPAPKIDRSQPGPAFPQNPGGLSTNDPNYNPNAPIPGHPSQPDYVPIQGLPYDLVGDPNNPASMGAGIGGDPRNQNIPIETTQGPKPLPLDQRPSATGGGDDAGAANPGGGDGGGDNGGGGGGDNGGDNGGGGGDSGWQARDIPAGEIKPGAYQIQEGDTLSTLAESAGIKDYNDIAKANTGQERPADVGGGGAFANITDPNKINTGDWINIPGTPADAGAANPADFTPGQTPAEASGQPDTNPAAAPLNIGDAGSGTTPKQQPTGSLHRALFLADNDFTASQWWKQADHGPSHTEAEPSTTDTTNVEDNTDVTDDVTDAADAAAADADAANAVAGAKPTTDANKPKTPGETEEEKTPEEEAAAAQHAQDPNQVSPGMGQQGGAGGGGMDMGGMMDMAGPMMGAGMDAATALAPMATDALSAFGGGGGMGDLGGMASGLGGGMASGIGDAVSGLVSGIGGIFGSRMTDGHGNFIEADRSEFGYPTDANHLPFDGSGPLPPLEYTTSEQEMVPVRNKMEDVTKRSDGPSMESMRDKPKRQGAVGITRAGTPPKRPPVEPEVVRVWSPTGPIKQGAADMIPDIPDPYSRTAASFREGAAPDDDPEPFHTASASDDFMPEPGVDVVAQFQRSAAAQAVMSENSGQSNDDLANAANAFLQRTAGRNFSMAEQAELMNERHPLGARNLDQLDLGGTHYEAENSVGLFT